MATTSYSERLINVLSGKEVEYNLSETFGGSVSENDYLNPTKAASKTNSIFLEDIAQSHYFTITLDKIKVPSIYKTRFDDNGSFLPVKSIGYTMASFENMSIPLGVLGSLPLLHRKNLGRLSLTLYDNHRDEIEKQVRAWVNSCFPGDKYVNYLSNIVGKLTYKSYTVTGKLNTSVSGTYSVIPADSVSMSRSYEENGAKLVEFSVVVIGRD